MTSVHTPASASEHQAWNALTDDDRDRAFATMPDMLDGFMKLWGWLHFAKAIEDICREKNPPKGTSGSDALEALRGVLEHVVPAAEFEYLKKGIGTSTAKGKAILAAQAAIAAKAEGGETS
jgi:hypothetical protein